MIVKTYSSTMDLHNLEKWHTFFTSINNHCFSKKKMKTVFLFIDLNECIPLSKLKKKNHPNLSGSSKNFLNFVVTVHVNIKFQNWCRRTFYYNYIFFCAKKYYKGLFMLRDGARVLFHYFIYF
jgi:hypothetical protein